jgi:hypothetical protein
VGPSRELHRPQTHPKLLSDAALRCASVVEPQYLLIAVALGLRLPASAGCRVRVIESHCITIAFMVHGTLCNRSAATHS